MVVENYCWLIDHGKSAGFLMAHLVQNTDRTAQILDLFLARNRIDGISELCVKKRAFRVIQLLIDRSWPDLVAMLDYALAREDVGFFVMDTVRLLQMLDVDLSASECRILRTIMEWGEDARQAIAEYTADSMIKYVTTGTEWSDSDDDGVYKYTHQLWEQDFVISGYRLEFGDGYPRQNYDLGSKRTVVRRIGAKNLLIAELCVTGWYVYVFCAPVDEGCMIDYTSIDIESADRSEYIFPSTYTRILAKLPVNKSKPKSARSCPSG